MAAHGALNLTLNGINVQGQRNDTAPVRHFFNSVDLIDEVRVVTAPATPNSGAARAGCPGMRSGAECISRSAVESLRKYGR